MKEKQKIRVRTKKTNDKSDRLLDAAYELFLEQGDTDVSIKEIADRAGVAKGTFYLYFHDKEDLKECLITRKSNQFFQNAIVALRATDIVDFEDQVIFVINYIINELAQNRMALQLIAKNLVFGVVNQKMQDYVSDEKSDIMKVLLSAAEKNGIRLRHPRILIYMIIELTGATCFSCIMESKPLPIEEYKPHLFSAIRLLIDGAIEK